MSQELKATLISLWVGKLLHFQVLPFLGKSMRENFNLTYLQGLLDLTLPW